MSASGDWIEEPPARESWVSPAGLYEFTVRMRGEPEDWVASGSEGSLRLRSKGTSTALWTRALPHSYRPRFALVNDQGQVALFDQWINVFGPHAVMVLDVGGSVIADHAFDDVAAAVGVERSLIAAQAQQGPWMTTRPVLADSGVSVEVGVANTLLNVKLDNGRLTSN